MDKSQKTSQYIKFPHKKKCCGIKDSYKCYCRCFPAFFLMSAKGCNKISPIAQQSLSFCLIKWTAFFTNMALFTPSWRTSDEKCEEILLRKGALQRP